MLTSKLEVLVDLGTNPEQAIINTTLSDLKSQTGIKKAVFKDGAFMVETVLPNQEVLDMVARSTGRRAVLQGFGDTQSAVAMVSDHGPNKILGVVRFHQSDGALVADGTVDGLPPGRHGVYIAEGGDVSQGCDSIGSHYNPSGCPHGAPGDPPGKRHAGDLGNILADERGRVGFRIVDHVLQISDIIGRAIAITDKEDDLGKGTDANSKMNGNSGPVIACGIIARSAGIFQNPKRVCQCDGVVVWDERDRPLAGAGRRAQKTCCGNHNKNESSDNKDQDTLNGVKRCCKV